MSTNTGSVESLDARRKARSLHDAERAVIGGLMLDNSVAPRIDLSPGDFIAKPHGQIFETIQRLIAQGVVAEPMMVVQKLNAETTQTNWAQLVAEIYRDTASAANTHVYAQHVRGASIGRRAAEIGAQLVQRSSDDAMTAIDDTIRMLMELTQTKTDWSCHQYEAMQAAIDYMDQAASGNVGVGYGLRDLTDKIGGMHPGDFVVIGARPAMGKTALALNMLGGCGVAAGLISGEQNRTQIGMRLMSINGRVGLHKMRRGILDADEWKRVNRVFAALKDAPVWLNDKPGPTIDEVKRQARAWKFEKGTKLLLVDYLQKIRGGIGHTRDQQVGDVASQLKDLARELEIPVVALAQVNRNVESLPLGADGMGRMPGMGDMRESGSIEAEADTIMTLYRPSVYLPDEDRFKGTAFVNVCKSRHGPVGTIQVAWRGEFLQFGDLARAEAE